MWNWKHNKELKEKYFAEYCKAEREGDLLKAKVKYNTFTYYERDTENEAKELKKIGLLDKYGNYTFWDNFPDNWKLSDEELEALDYGDYESDDWKEARRITIEGYLLCFEIAIAILWLIGRSK